MGVCFRVLTHKHSLNRVCCGRGCGGRGRGYLLALVSPMKHMNIIKVAKPRS